MALSRSASSLSSDSSRSTSTTISASSISLHSTQSSPAPSHSHAAIPMSAEEISRTACAFASHALGRTVKPKPPLNFMRKDPIGDLLRAEMKACWDLSKHPS